MSLTQEVGVPVLLNFKFLQRVVLIVLNCCSPVIKAFFCGALHPCRNFSLDAFSLGSFGIALLLRFLLNHLLATGKVLEYLFLGRHTALHPGVLVNLLDGGSLFWVELHDLLEHVLEFC